MPHQKQMRTRLIDGAINVGIALLFYLLPKIPTSPEVAVEQARRIALAIAVGIIGFSILRIVRWTVNQRRFVVERRQREFQTLTGELQEIFSIETTPRLIDPCYTDRHARDAHAVRCSRLAGRLQDLRIPVPEIPSFEKKDDRTLWQHYLKSLLSSHSIKAVRRRTRELFQTFDKRNKKGTTYHDWNNKL